MIFKGLRPVLVVLLILSITSFVFAKRDHTSGHAIGSVESTAPVIALQSVPPMTTGYDVICNLSPAKQSTSADISAWLRLRTPVDRRSTSTANYSTRLQSLPELVLLA